MNFLDVNFLYMALMLLCLSYPLLKSFETKIKFFTKWKYIFPSIFFMMLLFIPWDIYFTSKNVWSFNDDLILGYKFCLLPIEEWLFFIIIPFCCFFIHEVLLYFFPKNNIRIQRSVYYLLSVAVLIIAIFYKSNLYSFYVFLLSSILLFLSALIGQLFVNNLIRTFLVSLIPFIIVNGILTGSFNSSVVLYNSDEIINLRILKIPIEDFFYCFSMISLAMIPYQYLNNKFNVHQF